MVLFTLIFLVYFPIFHRNNFLNINGQNIIKNIKAILFLHNSDFIL